MCAANPGTATRFERDDQNQFRRACIIHHAFDTVTHWAWFLEALVEALPHVTSLANLVAVSDREKGLIPAVAQHLPQARHSYCSVHINRNVQSRFHINLSKEIHKLATSAISDDVTECLAIIHELDKDVPDYLIDSDLSKWVTARFPVPRYGIVTSNAAESMNNWIEKERSMVYFAVFVHVTRRTMERMQRLRDRFKRIKGVLVPWVETKLKKNRKEAKSRRIVPGNETLFEVQRKNGTFRVVDMDERTCSCKLWEEEQYPCVHAMAIVAKKRLQVADFVSPFFKIDRVRLCLSSCVKPVDVSECLSDLVTLPPPVYRSSGRPRAVRLRGRGEVDPEDSPIVCSKCKRRGHNVRTCDRRRVLREAREQAVTATEAVAQAETQAARTTEDSTPIITAEMIARLQEEAARAEAIYQDEGAFGSFWSFDNIFDSDPIM